VNLLTFDISNNALTDELPNDIGNLKMLERLDVSNNELAGSIPTSLSSLTSLKHLYLDNNYFEGTIQPNIFSNLTSLKELYLSFNMFEGAVPYLNNLIYLESVMLHSNNFDMIRSDTFAGTTSLQYVVVYPFHVHRSLISQTDT
jgi:Leucine-rich repeat (LRR) protein